MGKNNHRVKHVPIDFQIAKRRFDFLTCAGGASYFRSSVSPRGASCVSIASRERHEACPLRYIAATSLEHAVFAQAEHLGTTQNFWPADRA